MHTFSNLLGTQYRLTAATQSPVLPALQCISHRRRRCSTVMLYVIFLCSVTCMSNGVRLYHRMFTSSTDSRQQVQIVGYAVMQVSVDISTPPSAFEAVEAAAVAHFKANPNDFSGEKMIIANIAGDPLKYMLCVWWEYAYPGQPCTQCLNHAVHGVLPMHPGPLHTSCMHPYPSICMHASRPPCT